MPNSSDPQEIKKKQILTAAYKRFSNYGYSKTTMNDIAGDLSMSKALLYYYFPDKSQLYADVIRKVAKDYLILLGKKVEHAATIDEAFFFILEKMHETISSQYNFFDYIKLNQRNLPELIWKIIEEINQTQIDLLTDLYRKQTSGSFAETHNLREIIELIFTAVDSVNNSLHNRKNHNFFPDAEQLEMLYAQKKLLLQILLSGLKSL